MGEMLFLASTALTPTGVLVLVFGIAIYLVPTIVAFIGHAAHAGLAFLINLLFGWTIVGWAVSLMMATRSSTRTGALRSGLFRRASK